MTGMDVNTWRGVHDEVLRRIRERVWKPGELIPVEAELAETFGCARNTVNRALRALADSGVLERKRKSGTRVALHPVGKAVIEVPLIRREIEGQGKRYGYSLLDSGVRPATPEAAFALGLARDCELMQVRAIHLGDGAPEIFEDRWINLAAAPGAATVDFTLVSANAWLLENVPVSRGEMSISAVHCPMAEVSLLGADFTTPHLAVQRVTWNGEAPVTCVRLLYRKDHRILSQF